MLDKINRFIPLLILIVVVVILYFVFTNKKDTADQSNLLLAMAEKLGAKPKEKVETLVEIISEKIKTSEEVKPKFTDEEQNEILRIADMLCFNKELNAEEYKFYNKFNTHIDLELKNSNKILDTILQKFLSGAKDFDEYEKEFYETNQADIDPIVEFEKKIESIIKKRTTGITEFNEEELEFQQNHQKEIEEELNRINKGTTSINASAEQTTYLKGANPPLAQGERLKIILSLFDDGIPKSPKTIAQLYSEKTGTVFSKPNISGVLGKIEGKQLLCQEIKGRSDGKYFYGLPEWFDGKKFKKEYKPKKNK